MNRRRLLVLSLLIHHSAAAAASSKKYKLDVTWEGDYKQLFHRLDQACQVSRQVYGQSRLLYDQCQEHCQEIYTRFKETRERKRFEHLHPFLVPLHNAAADNNAPNAAQQSSSTFTRGGQQDSIDKFRIAVTLGLVLAFNSGYINGCCLSGATAHKQAVAAVTGAYTNSALGLASGNLSQFSAQLQVLLAYIFGSFAAGFIDPRPVAMSFASSRQPALLLAGALLAASSVLASRPTQTSHAYTYFLLAAMANGLQNSVTSSATANLCRTTHYTGMSSDIGTFVGQMVRGNNANKSRLNVFVSLAAAFWSGGVVSYFVVQRYQGLSLLLGAIIYFFVGSGLLQDVFLREKSTNPRHPSMVVTPHQPESERALVLPSLPPPSPPPIIQSRSGSLQSLAM